MKSLWAVLAMVLTCGLVAPAGTLAVAPANDDFANREVLVGALPIEVVGSNVEATKEEGEFIPGLSPAGHSVWYEWEATSTGWTTIGVCEAGASFPTILAVFTGSKVNELTSVVSGNASEGPDCPYTQRQFTFKAKAGTKYEIAVDGNNFYAPEQPKPVTEGEFTLRIEATPPPPNDDFANATQLAGEVSEEPGGNRFYFAHAQGYNWSATTELGEPSDDPSYGATVWYTWTPPETATYRLGGPCCGTGLNWDLYTGSSLEGLNEVLAATEPPTEYMATGGTTYRIAVYGTPDPETEEPSMASFGFNISANLPPLPPAPSPGSGGGPTPAPDTTAPQTTLVKSRLLAATRSATFWFSSSEAGSFLCRLDGKPLKPCTSPKSYRHLKPGRHTFRVKALDAAGNVDASPVVAHFRFSAQRGPHGR